MSLPPGYPPSKLGLALPLRLASARRRDFPAQLCSTPPHPHDPTSSPGFAFFCHSLAVPSILTEQGVSIFRPIVYGNIAIPVDPAERPKGMPTDHTHTWTICVKGVDGADITDFIKKVQFKLHADTYSNPYGVKMPTLSLAGMLADWRTAFEAPPYEVSESGWGEFEIQIKLFFHPESNEKPLTLFHYLKLHPYNSDEAELELARQQRRPVMSYVYDELVFNEPTEAMYDILTSKGTARLPSKTKAKGRGEFVAETEQVELDRLEAGLKIVKEKTLEVKEKLLAKEKEVAAMRKKLEE